VAQRRPPDFRARRRQQSDLIWGAALAVSLPLLTFLIMTALDVAKTGKAKLEASAFRDQRLKKPVPMPRELAEAYLREMQRLYDQNFRQVFMPRLNREDLTPEERIAYFQCAADVLSRIRTVYLKALKKALSEPGSEIQSFASAIQRWEATAEAAKEELDRLNPFPGTLGGGFGKSYSR